MSLELEKEIEDFMNSKVCKEGLRAKTDTEFSKYLAREIVKIINSRKN
jgi:hypothetical protein